MDKRETCFVIMPDNADCDLMYESAILPAIDTLRENRTLDLACIRVGGRRGGSHKVADIIENIQRAKVVIVDLTGNKIEILYELGLAHGLLNNVIMITQNSNVLPFDLSAYNVIEYGLRVRADDKLKNDLIASIETLDEWSNTSNPVKNYLPESELPVPAKRHAEMLRKLDRTESERTQLKEADEELRRTQRELTLKSQELTQKTSDLDQTTIRLKEVEDKLKQSENVQGLYQEKIDAYKNQEDEIQTVTAENHRLQGVEDVMAALFDTLFGEKVRNKSMDEVLKMFRREMREKGEVTLDFPSEEDRDKGPRREKIKFRRIK